MAEDRQPIPHFPTLVLRGNVLVVKVKCVGAVVLDEHGRLLVIRRRNAPDAGRWSLPGGRVEAGEAATVAIVREVAEETALTIEIVRELGTVTIPGPESHIEFVVRDFLCTPIGVTDPVAGDDATAVAWVDRDAFRALDLVDGLHDTLARWSVLPR